jgi:CheY-like chemotaxis protein
LVEMHDGQITATSEGLGKGSHFLITLPRAGPTQDEFKAPEDLPSEGDARRAIRALIVDDNIDAAVSLSLLLQLGGHTTCLAHSGAEAVEMVADFKPDIVLLDIGLPGMDGYEIARAIRGLPILNQPVLAAVTGWGTPEDRLRAKQAGFDEHLTKPVDISTIELLLTTLASRRTQGGEGGPPVENGHSVDTPH